jgi:hypothetical protein
MGAMVEADIYVVFGVAFSSFVCLGSMGMFWFLEVRVHLLFTLLCFHNNINSFFYSLFCVFRYALDGNGSQTRSLFRGLRVQSLPLHG